MPPQAYKTSQDVLEPVSRNPDVIGIADSGAAKDEVRVIKHRFKWQLAGWAAVDHPAQCADALIAPYSGLRVTAFWIAGYGL